MIRHAFRTISRMPGLAAVVILSLGVGIGVNTAVFSWIQTMVLKPIPGVDDSSRFYHVAPKADTGTYPGMSWAEYRDVAPQLSSIAELVVVISHDYWQRSFGGAPTVVGQTIRVNDLPLTIVGVAPEGFQGTILALQFDLWVPATLAPALFAGSSELDSRGQRGYSVMGRLRHGATQVQATSEFT